MLGPIGRRANHVIYRCLCECGKHKDVQAEDMINGRSRSCGCLRKQQLAIRATTHGQASGERSRAYNAWRHMKKRCNNPRSADFYLYGGRGIKHCPEWADFDNFYRDMGDCPPNHTIERKNNELGYCASNCCWATTDVQCNNRRNNLRVTYNGCTMTLSQAVKKYSNLRYGCVYYRVTKLGWAIGKALVTPLRAPARKH